MAEVDGGTGAALAASRVAADACEARTTAADRRLVAAAADGARLRRRGCTVSRCAHLAGGGGGDTAAVGLVIGWWLQGDVWMGGTVGRRV